MPSALIIIANGCEEIETITVADVLCRSGVQVTIASATDSTCLRGSRDLPMAADGLLEGVNHRQYDCVYLPGGLPQAEACCQDPRIQSIIRERLGEDRLLAVICASPMALAVSGAATRRRVTSYPGARGRVEPGVGQWLDERVVDDGQLITSQGPGTALELALQLAERLAGSEVAKQVAADMLVP